MFKRLLFLSLAICCLAAMSYLHADTIPDGITAKVPLTLKNATADEIKIDKLQSSHKMVWLGDGDKTTQDSIDYLIAKFYVDQFRQFQDPLAPYFLLISKDARIAMGMGGAVRMRGWFDFAGSMPTNGFVPYMIPVPGDPAQRRKLGGTPGGSAIFFRIIGRNRLLGDIIGYIQADFSASSNTMKLKKAYAEIGDFTVGYTSSTFKDGQAEAPTIDGAGQNGTVGKSSLLVRWFHTTKTNRWSYAASLEMPSSQTDCDGVMTEKISDWFPTVAALGQFNFAHAGHIRLSGILNVIPYRDLVTVTNRNRMGWGLQLSAVGNPVNRLTLYGIVNTGQGYQSQMGDLSIGNFDLVADAATPGRLYAPLALGLNLGLKYNFRPDLYACIALGEARYFPKFTADPSDYKYGLYSAVNMFYEPTPRIIFGIEYLYGQRHNFNREHAHANRIDALFQFSF